MGKKKYVKKNEETPQTQQKQVVTLEDWDDDTQKEPQFEFIFNFTPKQVLHLWLVGILPGKKFVEAIKFNLPKKTIIGVKKICEKKILECNKHIQSTRLQALSEKELNQNITNYLQKNFQAQIFGKAAIEGASNQIIIDYQMLELKKDIEQLLIKKMPYLISIKAQYVESFKQYIKSLETVESELVAPPQRITSQRITYQRITSQRITSQRINEEDNIMLTKGQKFSNGKQKQPSSDSDEYETAQSFYSVVYDSQCAKKEEKTSKEPQVQKKKAKQKKYVKVSQEPKEEPNVVHYVVEKREQKQVIFNEQYPLKYIDLDSMKNWIRNNKILQIYEFEFIRDAENVRIKMRAEKLKNEKLESLKIYFAFSKVFILNSKNKEACEKVEEKFCKDNKKQLKCQIVTGFMEPRTLSHKLRALIAAKRINKSGRNTEKFVALWIEGIKPLVEKLSDQIDDFIEHLPQQNPEFKIYLSVNHLKDHIYEKKVQDLISEVIDDLPKEYPCIVSKQLLFIQRQVLLTMRIQCDKRELFEMKDRQKIQKKLEQIICEQIMDEQDLNEKLTEDYILLKSLKNPGKIVLIEKQRQSLASTKSILERISLNNNEIIEKSLSLKRGRISVIKNFLAEVQRDAATEGLIKNIKIQENHAENKILITGTGNNVNKIHEILEEHIEKINNSLVDKVLYVSDQEAAAIEKNEKAYLRDLEQNYNISIALHKNINCGVIISMGNQKFVSTSAPLVIFVEKQRNIGKIPMGASIIFQSMDDLHFSNENFLMACKFYFKKNNKQAISTCENQERNYVFYYSQGFHDIKEFALHAMKNYKHSSLNQTKHFAFFMPKKNKTEFVMSLVNFYQNYIEKGETKVYIFEDPQQDLQQSLRIEAINKDQKMKEIKYYVSDKGVKFYYSPEGNKKINAARLKNEKKCYLENEDLNLTFITHKCSTLKQVMIHQVSSKQTKIKMYPDRIVFILAGREYNLPKKEEARVIKQSKSKEWVDISVGLYQINFQSNQQTNLFSGFKRALQFEEVEEESKLKYNLNVNYDYRVNQVEFIYDHRQEKNAQQAERRIKQLLEKDKTSVNHKLDRKITVAQFLNLQSVGLESNVEVKQADEDEVILKSYDTRYIKNFVKVLDYLLKPSSEVKYPDTWQPQKEQIEVFQVNKNTPEFQNVQKEFKISPIKKLIRIQNKLVYKKYIDEKNCLQGLNNGKEVKEMMLYHGTKTTKPELIYLDKQECFNINYTSENNYLGKGTYFAVLPQYSHNYAYAHSNTVASLFGQITRSMLYCSVLVGDSQQIAVVNSQSRQMKDTDYKNEKERVRYESSTTFTNGSVIYAVYKNRRAYPSYLISY